jgi:hypothetical protein
MVTKRSSAHPLELGRGVELGGEHLHATGQIGLDRARLHLRAELADVLHLLGEHVVVKLVVRDLEHAGARQSD